MERERKREMEINEQEDREILNGRKIVLTLGRIEAKWCGSNIAE